MNRRGLDVLPQARHLQTGVVLYCQSCAVEGRHYQTQWVGECVIHRNCWAEGGEQVQVGSGNEDSGTSLGPPHPAEHFLHHIGHPRCRFREHHSIRDAYMRVQIGSLAWIPRQGLRQLELLPPHVAWSASARSLGYLW